MTRIKIGLLLAALLGFSLTGCTRREVGDSSVGQPTESTAAIQEDQQEIQPDVLQADPAWFSCQKDADCKVVQGPCGEPQAVNARFIPQFSVYRDKMNQMVECNDTPRPGKTDPPRCLQNRCSLSLD